jgi:hypothetical protein
MLLFINHILIVNGDFNILVVTSFVLQTENASDWRKHIVRRIVTVRHQ